MIYIKILIVDGKMMGALKSMRNTADMLMDAKNEIVKKYETIEGVKYTSLEAYF